MLNFEFDMNLILRFVYINLIKILVGFKFKFWMRIYINKMTKGYNWNWTRIKGGQYSLIKIRYKYPETLTRTSLFLMLIHSKHLPWRYTRRHGKEESSHQAIKGKAFAFGYFLHWNLLLLTNTKTLETSILNRVNFI